VGLKFNLSNPVHLTIGSTASLGTWAAMGYPTDAKHLLAVAIPMVAGVTSHSEDSSSPNVPANSHIVTPYANNIEE